MRWLFCLAVCFLCFDPRAELAAQTTDDAKFADLALTPLWQAKAIRDSLFFIQHDASARPSAKLLFKPAKLTRVISATRETTFEEGQDYAYDAKTGVLTLPAGSRIPFKTLEQLYPLMTSDEPKIARQAGDKTRGIFFDNKAGYHLLQVEAEYEVEPGQWQGPTTKFAGDVLPHTLKKLQAKEPVKIVLSGDSISAGYNASKFVDAAPHCPAYGELVALGLQKHFGAEVSFENYAVSGWNAQRGLQRINEEKLAEKQPDLVIIAYGMNDVFARDAATYQQNIKSIMEAFRAKSPDVEFVLVATMLGNQEWGMPMEQFALYRDALKELTGPGVALVDMTAIWEELLKHKSFYDLCGNGVNHPNDVGHAIYAQAVAALLIEPKDAKSN